MAVKGALQRPINAYLVLTGGIDTFSKLSEKKKNSNDTPTAILLFDTTFGLVSGWSSEFAGARAGAIQCRPAGGFTGPHQ
jgi:hypothetical protein